MPALVVLGSEWLQPELIGRQAHRHLEVIGDERGRHARQSVTSMSDATTSALSG